jgi:hypothetical protein
LARNEHCRHTLRVRSHYPKVFNTLIFRSEEAVREWGAIAQEWSTITLGADNMIARQIAKIARNPRDYEDWGTRPRMVVERPKFTP